ESGAWYRVAGNFLTTYVGKNAGERVLAGHIRRGDTEAIHAAIWLSDMRGFTVLADTLPPQNLVDLLNRYFDCQVPAILEHGGEVLKYMGDGLLAIFQIGAERDYATTSAAALKAGRTARNQIAALSAIDGDSSGLRFGLALHVGDVLFGNIGSGNRLDFTCIGPAVNLAARLEKLAGRLGRTILASEDFVDHCGDDRLQPVGRFAVARFAARAIGVGLAREGKERKCHERTDRGGDRAKGHAESQGGAKEGTHCLARHGSTVARRRLRSARLCAEPRPVDQAAHRQQRRGADAHRRSAPLRLW